MARIFANGCFDLLHPGHLSLFEFCQQFGEVIVGVNSDESVRRLKGPKRPILNQEERLYALRSCRFVDEVHIFEEDTPYELIKFLRPDLIVKGSEFEGQKVIGDDLARVIFYQGVWDLSTSQIIRRIMESVD